MEHGRTIEINQEYREFVDLFEGIEITFRHHFANNRIFMKIDESFARANGYKSYQDMATIAPMLCEYEWVDTSVLSMIAEHQEWYDEQLKS